MKHKDFPRSSLLAVTLVAASLGLSGCSDPAVTELSDSERAALVERIKPVTTLADIVGTKTEAAPAAEMAPAAQSVAETEAPMPASNGSSAKPLYDAKCMMCHSTGAAGAPKIGDAAAWEARVAGGIEGLVTSAKAGKGAMPPNGGSAYSEDEMRQIIEYMLADTGLL